MRDASGKFVKNAPTAADVASAVAVSEVAVAGHQDYMEARAAGRPNVYPRDDLHPTMQAHRGAADHMAEHNASVDAERKLIRDARNHKYLGRAIGVIMLVELMTIFWCYSHGMTITDALDYWAHIQR